MLRETFWFWVGSAAEAGIPKKNLDKNMAFLRWDIQPAAQTFFFSYISSYCCSKYNTTSTPKNGGEECQRCLTVGWEEGGGIGGVKVMACMISLFWSSYNNFIELMCVAFSKMTCHQEAAAAMKQSWIKIFDQTFEYPLNCCYSALCG